MINLEQAQFDIAKAIYIEQIVNTDKKGKSLSEKEIAQEAISSAEIFRSYFKRRNLYARVG